MSGKKTQKQLFQIPGVQIPSLNGLVSGGGDQVAKPIIDDRPDRLHGFSVGSIEGEEALVRVRVPHLDALVERPGSDIGLVLPVEGGHACDGLRVALHLCQTLKRLQVPDPDIFILEILGWVQ